MRFSNNGSTASGVSSLPVKPVPPVVITTSIFLSLIHAFTLARIALMSSFTSARAARLWPAPSMRSCNSAPDLSSARSRVSETVSTAIASGTKGLAGSRPGMSLYSRSERAMHDQRIDRTELRVLESVGQPFHGLEAEALPEKHRALVRRHHEIEPHRAKATLFRARDRMRAHRPRHPAAGCSGRGHVAA